MLFSGRAYPFHVPPYGPRLGYTADKAAAVFVLYQGQAHPNVPTAGTRTGEV